MENNNIFSANFSMDYDFNVVLTDADETFIRLYGLSFSDIGKKAEELFCAEECVHIRDFIRKYRDLPYEIMRIREFPENNSLWQIFITSADNVLSLEGHFLRCAGNYEAMCNDFFGCGVISCNQNGEFYLSDMNNFLAGMIENNIITMSALQETNQFQFSVHKKDSSYGYINIPISGGKIRRYFMGTIPVIRENGIKNILIFIMYAGLHNMADNLLMDRLTPKECDVMRLCISGLSTYEIAEKFYIAEGTVKKELHSGYKKIGVCSKTEAILKLYNL